MSVEQRHVDLEAKLHNRFDVEVRDSRTGELKQRAVGYNVILNQFWTRLFNGNAYDGYIVYGSGTGTPSASDTTLFHFEGHLGRSDYVYDDSHYTEGWNSFTVSATLDEQTAVGVSITEVGLAGYDGSSTGALCTHALLKDMNGNTISITKTNTDIITIYATVYIHWNVNGINGLKYAPNKHWFGTALSASNLVGGKSMGFLDIDLSSSNIAPVGNSATKTWSWGPWRVPVGNGNVGGFSHVGLGSGVFDIDVSGVYQISSEAVGTGDGSTTEFALDFYDPYDVEVYIDGVQTNAFTVQLIDTTNGSESVYAYEQIDPKSSDSVHIPAYYWHNGNNYIQDTKCILLNKLYPNSALTGIYSSRTNIYYIYGSNNLEDWTLIGGGDRVYSWENQSVSYKYVKMFTGGGTYFWNYGKPGIVFTTAPAAGAVITANYKTPHVPKDENHVYDFSFSVTLGEYTVS